MGVVYYLKAVMVFFLTIYPMTINPYKNLKYTKRLNNKLADIMKDERNKFSFIIDYHKDKTLFLIYNIIRDNTGEG
jgi:hypothetical protein